MIVVEEEALCDICCARKAIILCDGCGARLCKECRKFDLWGDSCGHVYTKVFCYSCFDDPETNPYGGQRPD